VFPLLDCDGSWPRFPFTVTVVLNFASIYVQDLDERITLIFLALDKNQARKVSCTDLVEVMSTVHP
jgi:hypothetical protein